jgi:hypothetical protein
VTVLGWVCSGNGHSGLKSLGVVPSRLENSRIGFSRIGYSRLVLLGSVVLGMVVRGFLLVVPVLK